MKKEEQKRPVYISIATQKGGVGKSTLTAMAASVLQYRMGLNVVCVDVDYPQHSLHAMRLADIDSLKNDPRLSNIVNNQIATTGQGSYPIIKCSPNDAIERLNQLYNIDQIDVVLFDMPGTINQPGLVELLSDLDFIFIPNKPTKFQPVHLPLKGSIYSNISEQFSRCEPTLPTDIRCVIAILRKLITLLNWFNIILNILSL